MLLTQNPGGKVDIKVKRTNILEDSYNSVMAKSTVDLMRRLWITFDGEPGLDYGGVARFDCTSISLPWIPWFSCGFIPFG